ncbi:MAG: LysE family translocator [Actinobacteria bacterium]|nr:LysE family translocator [Actinomycetota bacterium]
MDVAALVTLAFVASITPGPNNLMLLASGMNHGTHKTLPHLAGVSFGFAFLMFVIAVGLGTVFERYDSVELALRLLGGTYLAYLAWKIFNTSDVATTRSEAAPMTFVQAALFQWVNPKAWVMATTASSTLLVSTGSVVAGAATLTGGFWVVNLPCISTWMFSGVFASRWVNNARRLRFINRTLGVLLAGTVILLLA